MKIDGASLDAMVIEPSSQRLYLDNVAKNQVEVLDRTITASWPITLAEKSCVTITLDEAHHQLFVGCRTGQIVVFDTENGQSVFVLEVLLMANINRIDPSEERRPHPCVRQMKRDIVRESGAAVGLSRSLRK
jgi:hypothetical protein